MAEWALCFISKIDLSTASRVLDVGCRDGVISSHLASTHKSTIFSAIDQNLQKIQIAKNHYQLPNLSFEHENPAGFRINNQYDIVTSFSCLHWQTNKLAVLKNIYSALKPGGKAYLQFFAQHGHPKNDRFLYETAYSPKWKPYFNQFSPAYSESSLGQFISLLSAVGFIVQRAEFQNYPSKFSHQDQLIEWLGTWATHKHKVPKHKQEIFLSETVDNYLNWHSLSKANSFFYYEYLLEITCQKPDEKSETKTDFHQLYRFTIREQFVLKHYLQGKSAKEISSIAPVSAKTVEFHLANIKKKLNCVRRSDLYKCALKSGFIDLVFSNDFPYS